MNDDRAAERWRELSRLFDAALDLPNEDGARDRFVADSCGADADLRRELEELLAARDTPVAWLDGEGRAWAERLLEEAASAAVAAGEGGVSGASGVANASVGPWRLGRLLGEGGMGTVYEAERSEGGFKQRAAVKLLRGGGLSPLLTEQFLRERGILARLEHPGIARFLDGGVTADGLPWFALERVEGEPVTVYLRRTRAGVERRLEIALEIAGAVSYAHRNLVVHRDLKPSNILIDAAGRVKLLDFGIAKLLAAEGTGGEGGQRTTFTALTPEYAAPEQRSGGQISTATDVYALGVLLFEILAGRLPSPPPSEPENERPSAAAIASPDRPEGRALRSRLRGDLDRIVARAVAADPERRYPSVESFADDVARHLAGLPVRARGDSIAYRASRFVRRHRLGVAAAAIVSIALVAALAVSRRQTARAEREAERARAERAQAESALGFLLGLFGESDPSRAQGRTRSDRELLAEATERIGTDLAGRPELQIPLWNQIAAVYAQVGDYARGEKIARRVLDDRTRRFGPSALETARARSLVAEFDFWADRFAASRAGYRTAAAALELAGAESEGAYVDALVGAAACERELGDLAAGELLLRRAVERARLDHGERSEAFAGASNALASLVSSRGNFADTVLYARQAADAFRAIHGLEHQDTLITMLNLAIAQSELGDGAAARETLAPVLPLLEKLLGPDHIETLIGHRLAAVFAEQDGDFARARSEIETVLTRLAAVTGADSRASAFAQLHAAWLYRASGEAARGEAAARAAVAHFRAAGPEENYAGWAEAALAELLVETGRLGEAAPLVEHALAIEARAGVTAGRDHADVLDAAGELARATGDRGAARHCFEEALAARRSSSAIGNRLTARELTALAALPEPGDSPGRCRELAGEAVKIYARTLAASHPERAAAERQLAACGG